METVCQHVPELPQIERLESLVDDAISSLGEQTSTLRVARALVPLGTIDPLHWLAAQPTAQQLYWRNRDGDDEVAGVGVAYRIHVDSQSALANGWNELERIVQAAPDLRFYGGMSFNGDVHGDEWRSFGRACWVVPRFEVRRGGDGQTTLACNVLTLDGSNGLANLRAQVMDDLQKLCLSTRVPDMLSANIRSVRHEPDTDGWRTQVEDALAEMAAERMRKVVLARRTRFGFDATFDHFSLLERLREVCCRSYIFMLTLSETSTLVGASPERLYRRDGENVTSEAIAGTRPRGRTPEEDDKLEAELAASEKDVREHQNVVSRLTDAFAALGCPTPDIGERYILRLARVRHWYQSMAATLPTHISDAEIIAALHPTSAVGGDPRSEALAFIADHEPFDRGWYAGPFGCISHEHVELAVAIRSGLISDRSLSVYTGAGIIDGSAAASEWDELEAKLQWIMQVLH